MRKHLSPLWNRISDADTLSNLLQILWSKAVISVFSAASSILVALWQQYSILVVILLTLALVCTGLLAEHWWWLRRHRQANTLKKRPFQWRTRIGSIIVTIVIVGIFLVVTHLGNSIGDNTPNPSPDTTITAQPTLVIPFDIPPFAGSGVTSTLPFISIVDVEDMVASVDLDDTEYDQFVGEVYQSAEITKLCYLLAGDGTWKGEVYRTNNHHLNPVKVQTVATTASENAEACANGFHNINLPYGSILWLKTHKVTGQAASLKVSVWWKVR